jgi:molybdopterin converting factor small subunit
VTVTVLLFARVADLLGAERVHVSLPVSATASDVLAALRALPGGDAIPPSTRLAVNHCFVAGDARVDEHDELAAIPPVAGG